MFATPPREVKLIGSNQPVTVQRLLKGVGNTTQNAVVFPRNWTRSQTGSFAVAEEALWLDGEFTMNGTTFVAGTYCWFPADYVRSDSRTATGARALAWFGGPPQWTPAAASSTDGSVTTEDAIVVQVDDCPKTRAPAGAALGRLLRRTTDGSETWVLDGAGGRALTPGWLVTLDGAWARSFAAGDTLPDVREPVLMRLSP